MHSSVHSSSSAGKPAVTLHTRALHDVDDQARSLPGWTQEYLQLGGGKYAGAITSLTLPQAELFIESSNLQVHQTGEVPKDSVVLGLTLNAGGNGWLAGKKFDDNTLIVLANGHELDFRTPPDLTVVALVVDAAVFSDYVRAFDINAICDSAINSRFAAIPPAIANTLRQYIQSVTAEIRNGSIDLSQPAAEMGFRSNLISNFVQALVGIDSASQTIPRSAQLRRRTVGKAVEYIRSHIDEPISIIDVCANLHVEQRVLLYCFQEVLGLSPVSYLKLLRLNQVRRELRFADPTASVVGDIATRWGFWHLSRFSADYRKLFGELPSDTLRKNA